MLKTGHRQCLETPPERSRAATCVFPSILSPKKNLPFPSSSSRLISSCPLWHLALAHSGSIPLIQRGFWSVLGKLWASLKNWVLTGTQNANIPVLHFLHLGNYWSNYKSSSRQEEALWLNYNSKGLFFRQVKRDCAPPKGRWWHWLLTQQEHTGVLAVWVRVSAPNSREINIYQCCNQFVISGSQNN